MCFVSTTGCPNSKCLNYYNGWWANPCTAPARTMFYCAAGDVYCCTSACRITANCVGKGGFCISNPNKCVGTVFSSLCKGISCYCCVPPQSTTTASTTTTSPMSTTTTTPMSTTTTTPMSTTTTTPMPTTTTTPMSTTTTTPMSTTTTTPMPTTTTTPMPTTTTTPMSTTTTTPMATTTTTPMSTTTTPVSTTTTTPMSTTTTPVSTTTTTPMSTTTTPVSTTTTTPISSTTTTTGPSCIGPTIPGTVCPLTGGPGVNCNCPRSCKEYGSPFTGFVEICPISTCPPVQVKCIGEWTVFLCRIKAAIPQCNFTRDWDEYKLGFGSYVGEYWLGNAYLHALTGSTPHQFRMHGTHPDGSERTLVYSMFSVGSESTNYRLSISGFDTAGSVGIDLFVTPPAANWILDGMSFSTYDMDNDNKGTSSCSLEQHGGGWWFNDCTAIKPTQPNIDWYFWNAPSYTQGRLSELYMAIRGI
ncbi:uncharacterized protein [Palaemon carinicauda]|uniref:uncharacterized protein n=1 Tax=Palaemon carinicauda TaxID=392227 RepID=UPI0035B59C53